MNINHELNKLILLFQQDFEVKIACENGVSNLSDLLAVSVKYEFFNASWTKDLIIKLLPHDPFSRFFVTEAQFDLREIKFYTNVSTNHNTSFSR